MIMGRFINAFAFFIMVAAASLLQSSIPPPDHEGPPPTGPTLLKLTVKPSMLSYKVDVLEMRRKDLTAAEIAAIANAQIPREGLDYEFDLQNFIKERGLQPTYGETLIYRLPLETVEGTPVEMELAVGDSADCGEQFALIPLMRLTPSEIDVIVKGKRYRLRRPKSFQLESMYLVDSTLKNSLRKWELPYVAEPKGVSADGKVVYFLPDNRFYGPKDAAGEPDWPEVPPPHPNSSRRGDVMLAISDGVYYYVDSAVVPKQRFKHIPSSDAAHGEYRRFYLGKMAFTIYFSFPCD